MKTTRYLVLVLAVASAVPVFAQSESYLTLKDHFRGTKDVYSFKVSGFLCRAALSIAGEHDFREAIRDVSSVRLITIPRDNFGQQNLSVAGFRKYLASDHFESLLTVRDHGELVEFYLQAGSNHNDVYFVLIEKASEVTAIEIRGAIDLQKLKAIDDKNNLSYQHAND